MKKQRKTIKEREIMKTEIKLLCRDCALKEAERTGFGYCKIDYGNEHCGYCDECACLTGHLLAVTILKVAPKIKKTYEKTNEKRRRDKKRDNRGKAMDC